MFVIYVNLITSINLPLWSLPREIVYSLDLFSEERVCGLLSVVAAGRGGGRESESEVLTNAGYRS